MAGLTPLAGTCLALGAVFTAGLLMAFSAMSARGLLSSATHDQAAGLHVTATVVSFPMLLLAFTAACSPSPWPTWHRAGAAMVTLVVAIHGVMIYGATSISTPLLCVSFAELLLLGAVMMAATRPRLAARDRRFTPMTLALVIATLSQFAAAGMMAWTRQAYWQGAAFEALVLVAIATVGNRDDESKHDEVRSLLLLLLAILAFRLRAGSLQAWAVVARTLLAAALIGLTWLDARREAFGRWARLATRFTLLLFAERFLLQALLEVDDTRRSRTLLDSAAIHTAMLGISFALLSRWLRHRQPTPNHAALITVSLWMAGIGGQVLSLAMAWLGWRGMPRGYIHYLAQFESAHVWLAVGGAALAVGGAATIALARCAPIVLPVTDAFD